jgi:PKD repeat protein
VGESLAFGGGNSRDNDGSTVGYAWNFGDGATASGVSTNHNYGQPGTYEVALTVTDNGGLTGRSTYIVHISDVPKIPPTAAISGPVAGMVNDPLTFDGSGSSDRDGKIVGYAWDFGDGTTGKGPRVTHTYPVFGTYQVTLTVADNDGLSAKATQTVTIDEVVRLQLPPNVALTVPSLGLPDENLIFDASASNDPDGQIVNYTWDFGDGFIQSGLLITPTHSYSQTGVYTVSLTLTDNDGLINSTAQPVTIN